MADYSTAENTIVLSDIHLADAERPHPRNPLWKRFKQPRYFVDPAFKAFLEHLLATIPGPIELVLNGDIFDFDSVMARPEPGAGGGEAFHLSWLERARGMHAEQDKSRFKILRILRDHSVWVESLRSFLAREGNRLVFVIGNHDMELHWPGVQQDLLAALAPGGDPDGVRDRVRFCEWFYVSNRDTLIEHGNQYDAYSLSSNPINPLIRKGSRVTVRIPFGNLAGKFMLNGMGLMNPHAESSYIKSSLTEYLHFYVRYVIRTQPLLLWTWFWSALVTLGYSIAEGLLPAMTDPLTIGARIEEIAARSNSHPKAVLSLRELHAHPAIYNPIKILRELWLDRAIFLALIVFGSFQFFSVLNVFVRASFWWFVIPLGALMPMFIFYARSVESEVQAHERGALLAAPTSALLAGVTRVVHGHTHHERHTWIRGVEVLNTGTWSPAYHDVECTQPFGRKCFAWVRPGSIPGGGRTAELLEWAEGEIRRIPPENP
ncbi:MAG: metallophosphoesterase [Oligoflexia bacterium]|nr:metallophosphoesterase [Oligoflexia bacterium]